MKNDWRRDSTGEAKIIGAAIGAVIGLGIASVRIVGSLAVKSAQANMLRRCRRRDQIKDQMLSEIFSKLPKL